MLGGKRSMLPKGKGEDTIAYKLQCWKPFEVHSSSSKRQCDFSSTTKLTLHDARKRRRRGSRSASGRSSDRSGTRRASAACSDFPVAVATDSSGELFVNADMNWLLDPSESADRDYVSLIPSFESLGMESGYGSEPGYRGDAEFGYGDEEDDDHWGDDLRGTALSKMEKVGEKTLQKVHHRCRRRKQDCKMAIP